jgi:hypothetical protein
MADADAQRLVVAIKEEGGRKMITISPVGLAAAPVANQLSFEVTFKERLCRPFCITSTIQPQVSITYTVGTPTLNVSTVFIPITAVMTVVTQSGCGCEAHTQLFTENFTIAFQGQTAIPKSITLNPVGRVKGGSCIVCGKAHGYTVNDSLTVAIVPATRDAGVTESTATETA